MVEGRTASFMLMGARKSCSGETDTWTGRYHWVGNKKLVAHGGKGFKEGVSPPTGRTPRITINWREKGKKTSWFKDHRIN